MRRTIRLLLTVFLLATARLLTVAQQPAPKTQTEAKEQAVYITKTGNEVLPYQLQVSVSR